MIGYSILPPQDHLNSEAKKQKAVVIGLHGLKLVQNIFCFLQNLLWFQASFFKDSNNKQNHNTLVNIQVQRNSPSWYNAFAEIRSSSLFWPSMSWLDSVSAILFFYCWVTLVGTCHINPLRLVNNGQFIALITLSGYYVGFCLPWTTFLS